MTTGSTYKKKGSDDSFIITAAYPFYSEANVTKGSFVDGDLAVEDTHKYPYEPQRVFVRAFLPQDETFAKTLRSAVADIPGYRLVTAQKDSDLLLLVIRPLRKNGELLKEKPEATLPLDDPAAKPEVWLLTANEKPTSENLRFTPDNELRTIKLVTESMKKMSRRHEILHLGSGSAGTSVVDLMITRYVPDQNCKGEQCLKVPEVADQKIKGLFSPVGTFPANTFQMTKVKQGDILTLTIKNNSTVSLYCYLLDITSHGKIEAIYPMAGETAVVIPPDKDHNFKAEAGVVIDEPGEDTIKVIASQQPLDVSLFEQEVYVTRESTETRGDENPLEDFLARSMGGATRSGLITSNKRAKWGTVQVTVIGE